MAYARTLPAISAVDRADNHLGHLLSDLDDMTSAVERFGRLGALDKDAVFCIRHGIDFLDDDEPGYTDPATIARLLVFADEIENDSEAVRDYGRRLRSSLLAIYRERVIEPNGRSRARGGDDA